MGDERSLPTATVRRAFSLVLLAILLWVTIQSTGGRTFQICSDRVFDDGSKTLEICRPLEPTDPAFLVGLLALAPLAPDLQRLQVGSLIAIERRLEATEASQEALRTQVDAIVVQQSVRQEQHQHLHMPEPHVTSHVHIRVPEDELQRKEREFLRSEEVSDGD